MEDSPAMIANSPARLATRKLGRAGVEVTELGFGTAPLGENWDIIEEDEASALLRAAWDGGVRYFDTSPWYGKGQAEHRVGRALYRHPRDEFVISSKIGRLLRRPLKPGPFEQGEWLGGLKFDAMFDYSYDGVMRSFEDSLQRLGINRIDVLLIHDLDTWHFKTEAKVAPYMNQLYTSGWRALEELRDQGVIKGIGAGFNTIGHDPALSRSVRHGFLPDRDALHAARTGSAGPRVSALRRARRRHRHRRHLQFRHPGDRRGAGGEVQLRSGRRRISWRACRKSRRCASATACRSPPRRCSSRSAIRSSPRSFPARSRASRWSMNIAAFSHPIPADLWAELKHEKLIRADAPAPKCAQRK